MILKVAVSKEDDASIINLTSIWTDVPLQEWFDFVEDSPMPDFWLLTYDTEREVFL